MVSNKHVKVTYLTFIFYSIGPEIKDKEESRRLRKRWWCLQGELPLQEEPQKLQNRWRYSAQERPHQIRQMAQVHQNPETEENPYAETQGPTKHCPIRQHCREISR